MLWGMNRKCLSSLWPGGGVVLVALCCLALLSGCASRAAPSVVGSNVSRTALSAVGTRYVHGGASPSRGFDCSGLVSWAYAKNGIALPRTADEQSEVGEAVDREDLLPGDIVVFSSFWSGTHTGVYTGQGKFVHSPRPGKRVRVESLDSDYWSERFDEGRRHANMQ
jgi:cell wall-associated NlpC family hydrolase